MKIKEMDGDQRRIFIDARNTYAALLDAKVHARSFEGGMRWKSAGGHEYLFKTLGGKGLGKSLGRRTPETESVFENFHAGKQSSRGRIADMQEAVRRQAKFCLAAEVGRVPRVAANVVRVLDSEGLMGRDLMILGTHALYAYEAAAGVQFESGLLATRDVDLLMDVRVRLRLGGEASEKGLIACLQKADKTFVVQSTGHYRAVNSKGFMVDLIRPACHKVDEAGRSALTDVPGDLTAAEANGTGWLLNVPHFEQIAIAEDGYPVRLHVPDPRAFALMKLWVSRRPDRDPVKRYRDRAQAQAVAHICTEYLSLGFDDPGLRGLPQEVRSLAAELTPRRLEEMEIEAPPGLL